MTIDITSISRTMVALGLTTFAYDALVVSYLETHINGPHAMTAWEVVGGTMIVLVFYLLLVQGKTLTGFESFALILAMFIAGGLPMILGSYYRAMKAAA